MTARTTRRLEPLDGTYGALCKRKAGREAIFAELAALAAEYGATVTRSEYDSPFEITATIHLPPYALSIDLDGRSRMGAFYGAWYTDVTSDARYPAGFDLFGEVNRFHKRKATTVCDYFDAFKTALRGGLALLVAENQKAA